jgi:hypothetical protein
MNKNHMKGDTFPRIPPDKWKQASNTFRNEYLEMAREACKANKAKATPSGRLVKEQITPVIVIQMLNTLECLTCKITKW